MVIRCMKTMNNPVLSDNHLDLGQHGRKAIKQAFLAMGQLHVWGRNQIQIVKGSAAIDNTPTN